MVNCCAVAYIIVSGLATLLGIVACFVSLFMVTASSGSYSGGVAQRIPVAHQTITAPRNATLVARRVAEAQSVTLLSCPVYAGVCQVFEEDSPITTSDFLSVLNCGDGLGSIRIAGAAAVALAGISAGAQIPAVFREDLVRGTRSLSMLVAFAANTCFGVAVQKEFNIAACLHDSYRFTAVFDGDVLVMVSAIVLVVAGGLQTLATIGIMCSFWICRPRDAQQQVIIASNGQVQMNAVYITQEQYLQLQAAQGVVPPQQQVYCPPPKQV